MTAPPESTAKVMALNLKVSYRLTTNGGNITKLDIRLDSGSMDLNPSRIADIAPLKLQLVAAYRLPDGKFSLFPRDVPFSARFALPSEYKIHKKSGTHYDVSGPIQSIAMADEDQDISKYFLYAMVFINAQGAYVPGLSAALQPSR